MKGGKMEEKNENKSPDLQPWECDKSVRYFGLELNFSIMQHSGFKSTAYSGRCVWVCVCMLLGEQREQRGWVKARPRSILSQVLSTHTEPVRSFKPPPPRPQSGAGFQPFCLFTLTAGWRRDCTPTLAPHRFYFIAYQIQIQNFAPEERIVNERNIQLILLHLASSNIYPWDIGEPLVPIAMMGKDGGYELNVMDVWLQAVFLIRWWSLPYVQHLIADMTHCAASF